MLNFFSLPDELKLDIFSYLSFNEIVKCREVCKDWLTVIDDQSLWKQHLEKQAKVSEQELAYIEANGGYKEAFKVLKLMLENMNNPTFIEELAVNNPIAGILFFASNIWKYWNFPQKLSQIAKNHIITANSLLSRAHFLERFKSEIENSEQFDKNNILILAISHAQTAELLFNHPFFNSFFENIDCYLLANIASKSIEHAKLILQKFSKKFIKDNAAQPLSEMAQSNTEIAKLVLQDENFLTILSQPDQYSRNTDLHIIASSNIETADWVFSMPNIANKLTLEDLNSMFENDDEYGVGGKIMKELYDKHHASNAYSLTK